MSGITNSLISKSKKISDNFDARKLDVLLSTGEQGSNFVVGWSTCV